MRVATPCEVQQLKGLHFHRYDLRPLLIQDLYEIVIAVVKVRRRAALGGVKRVARSVHPAEYLVRSDCSAETISEELRQAFMRRCW